MTIRVVSIISRMNVGGPAVLLGELIEQFPAEGIEHTLITGRCLPNEIDYLATKSIQGKVIYINSLKRSILPLGDLKSFLILLNHLFWLKPDVVHTHTSKAGVLGRIAAKIASPRSKIIHTYHGHLLYGYFSNPRKFLMIKIERILSMISDHLIGVSTQVRDDLLAVGVGRKSKWVVLRPGISPKNLPPATEIREELNLPEHVFTIAWVGRFTDIKNPLLVIEVAKRLIANQSLPFQIVMAGEGELWDCCRNEAASNNLPIRFLGWVESAEPLLKVSDVLLMTSKNEGMPVVILEAALQSRPTISTNVGGVNEFIDSGINGLLVEEDAPLLSQAILRLMKAPDFRSSLASKAYELAINDFSLNKSLADHVDLYRLVTRL